jgi:protein-S-isoprenylcysteine O-methyltransferase Ste14
VRVKRRTGIWPIVVGRNVGRSGAPHQRRVAWAMRAFGLGVAGWLVGYAVAGPAVMGVWAAPRALTVAGWALVAAALALLVTAQAQMGAAWRIGIDERRTALVTHGLYRLVRNPIYSAMGLVLLGVVLVAPSLWSIAATVGVLVALSLQTRLEERHLGALHGDAYRGYAARVGRFVPGLGRIGVD